MKKIIAVILSAAFILMACGHAENKADPSDTAISTKEDTTKTSTDTKVSKAEPKTQPTNIKDNATAKSGQSRGINPSGGANDILANIDQYLTTTPQFTALPSGGFTECTIKVTNTLPDASFQKAVVEFIVQKENGDIVKTNYYNAINIDPASTRIIRIPNSNLGTKIITHIIKVKSNELTNGESVPTGSQYVAN